MRLGRVRRIAGVPSKLAICNRILSQDVFFTSAIDERNMDSYLTKDSKYKLPNFIKRIRSIWSKHTLRLSLIATREKYHEKRFRLHRRTILCLIWSLRHFIKIPESAEDCLYVLFLLLVPDFGGEPEILEPCAARLMELLGAVFHINYVF